MGIRGFLKPVSYTHLRAHETVLDLVCRLLLEKKKLSYMDCFGFDIKLCLLNSISTISGLILLIC